ncbi:hypothetical protein pb186bvf_017413 [Paramecium bursaria]
MIVYSNNLILQSTAQKYLSLLIILLLKYLLNFFMIIEVILGSIKNPSRFIQGITIMKIKNVIQIFNQQIIFVEFLMELWRLLLFYVLCVLLQGCLLYKSQNIDCQLKYKCNGKIQKDDFGLPKIEILYYEVLVVICLPLFYLFKLLFKRQHFRIVLILTTILYLIINAIILIFICTFIFSLYQIQVKEKQYNKNKCKLVSNCQEGNLFYILQMIMFSAWQIIFTYIYLQQNGKYRPMIELFRRFGLLFRIILVNISILWFLWDNFNVYLVLEKFLLCSEYCFSRDEKYMAYVILAQFINLNLILIYTLVLQIKEIFTTIGHERRKNKWLNFIIIYTQISFLLFGVTFNTVIQLFSSYLLFFLYLYLFIQLNSYQSLYVKQESNKYYIQTNTILPKMIRQYILAIQLISYILVIQQTFFINNV